MNKALKIKNQVPGDINVETHNVVDNPSKEHLEKQQSLVNKAGGAGLNGTPVGCPGCWEEDSSIVVTEITDDLSENDLSPVDVVLESEESEMLDEPEEPVDNTLNVLIEEDVEEEDGASNERDGRIDKKEFVEYSALVDKLVNMSKGERLHIIKKVDPSQLSADDETFLEKNKSSIDRYQNKFDKLIKDIKEHINHGHNPIKDLSDQLAKPPEKLGFWQRRKRALGTAALKNRQEDGRTMVDFRDGRMVGGRENYSRETLHYTRSLARSAISLVFGKNWADNTLKEHYQAVADKVNKHNEFSYTSIGALDHGTIFGIGDDNEPMTLDEMTDVDTLMDKYLDRPKSKREKLSEKIGGVKKDVKEKVSGIFEYLPNEPEPPRVLEHLDTHQVLSKLNLAHDPDLVTRLAAVFDSKNYGNDIEEPNFTFGDVDPASMNEKELRQSFDYSRVVKGYQKADTKLEQILLKAPHFNRFDPDSKVWNDFVEKAGGQDGEARQMIRMVQENLRAAPQILEERAQSARKKWSDANDQLRKHFTESDFKTKNGEVANFTYLLVEFRDKKMIEVRINIGNKDGIHHDENDHDHENGRVIGYIDYETGVLYSPPAPEQ